MTKLLKALFNMAHHLELSGIAATAVMVLTILAFIPDVRNVGI